MHRVKWLAASRWLDMSLVVGYVFVTIVMAIVLLMVFGVRMAEWAKWGVLTGWAGICFGGVAVAEWLYPLVSSDCRKPIGKEEDRLMGLVEEIGRRAGLEVRIQFLIWSDPEKKDGSFGFRTILIGSGSLQWASDAELSGLLAHELGHLRDGDKVLDGAFAIAGLGATIFRWCCRALGWGFRKKVVPGMFLTVIFGPVLFFSGWFFLIDLVFRGFRWTLNRSVEYRQDDFAFRSGFGEGLCMWLEKSGLAANADRIRRLEKLM